MKREWMKIIALNVILVLLLSVPFSAFADNSLTLGTNYLDEASRPEWSLVFAPDEDAEYKFTISTYASLSLYDGEDALIDDLQAGYRMLVSETVPLEQGKTYDVKYSRSEESGLIWIEKYRELTVFQDIPEGNYYYQPDQTGYYLTTLISLSAQKEPWGYYLEAGEKYYLTAEEGGSIQYNQVEFEEFMNDSTAKEAGYYIFVPEENGYYSFSTEIVFSNEEQITDIRRGEKKSYLLEAGTTYKGYLAEDFTYEIEDEPLPLAEGVNRVPAGTYSFATDKAAWHKVFYSTSGSDLRIYKASNNEIVPSYFLSDPEETYMMESFGLGSSIEIRECVETDSLENLSEKCYVYTAEQTGHYQFNESVSIYDFEWDRNLIAEFDAYELVAGKQYMIIRNNAAEESLLNGTLIERTYLPLPLNETVEPGYYSLTPSKGTLFAFNDENVEIHRHYYTWFWHEGERYTYLSGETEYLLYSPVAFSVRENGDFLYTVKEDETLSVMDYYGNEKTITVPGEISGKAVSEVKNLYEGNYLIVSEGIKSVDLNHNYNLAFLELADSVEAVNMHVYASMGYLRTFNAAVSLPAGIESLENISAEHIFFRGTEQQWEALEETEGPYMRNAPVHLDATDEDYTITYNDYGEIMVYCNICEEIIRNDCYHRNSELVVDQPANCGYSGYGHRVCRDCGDSSEADITIWPTGKHTPSEMIVDQAPTCGMAGYGHKVCTVCGLVGESDLTIKPTGKHTAGALIVDKAATCGAAGVGHKNCTVCGALVEANVAIPATEQHTAGNWKSTVQPTYEKNGTDTKYCTTCNKVLETRTVEKLTKAAEVFSDVTEKNWYHEAVSYAYSNNLFKGVTATTFGPGREMTRGMLVTVLWRYAGQPKGATHSFTDVPDGKYYSEAVAWAAANGIVNGVDDHRFNPNGIVTRAQMATILYRYSQSVGLDTAKTTDFTAFPDGSSVKNWAKDGMQWAVAEGLITGSKNNGTVYLVPGNGATRAQVATILMRYIENIVEV